jgi:hypothetical protein
MKTVLLTLAAVLASVSMMACDEAEAKWSSSGQAVVLDQPANADEIEGLLFVREEEKLARDVYLHFDAVWGTQTFANIAGAERRHMDAILGLLAANGVADPVAGLGQGEFANPELQALFDDLVRQGEVSEVAALSVGAFIEEYDIADLIAHVEGAESQTLIETYDRLHAGSEKHLNAFVGALEQRGVTYVPVILDQATYDGILANGGSGQGGQRGANRKGRRGGR